MDKIKDLSKSEIENLLKQKELGERRKKELIKYERRKQKLSEWLVPFIIFANIAFSLLMIFLFYRTGNEPSTLIDRWFQFTGVELVAMAGIQVTNIIGEHFGRNE